VVIHVSNSANRIDRRFTFERLIPFAFLSILLLVFGDIVARLGVFSLVAGLGGTYLLFVLGVTEKVVPLARYLRMRLGFFELYMTFSTGCLLCGLVLLVDNDFWLLAVAAYFVFSGQTKRVDPLSCGIQIFSLESAFLYACMFALFAVFWQLATGMISPEVPLMPGHSSVPSAYYFSDTTLTLFEKSHVRSMASRGASIFLTLLCFLRSIRVMGSWRGGHGGAHAALALTMLVAFISVCPIPPFNMDGPHWSHFVGPSEALMRGRWPFYDVFSYYGFLPVVLLSVWSFFFGTYPTSLAVLLSLLMFASALLFYQTIRRESGSNWFAGVGVSILLLLAYDHNIWALAAPNHSALRFHFFVAIVLFVASLFFRSLLRKQIKCFSYALCLGVLSNWHVVEGATVFAGVLITLTVATAKAKEMDWGFSTQVFGAYVAGVIIFPFVGAVFRSDDALSLLDVVSRTWDFLSVFPRGYGGLPQKLGTIQLVFFVCFGAVAVFCLERWRKAKPVTGLFLFCVFSLIFCLPFIFQELNRGSVQENGPIWVILPAFLALLIRLWRVERKKKERAKLRGLVLVGLVAVLSTANPVTVMTGRIESILFKYEPMTHTWAMNCAASLKDNLPCEAVVGATLAGAFEKELLFDFERSAQFLQMVEECRQGALIVDALDSFVYAAGDCLPDHEFPAFFSISTSKQMERFGAAISGHEPVIFGSGHFGYQQRLLEDVRSEWLAHR